MQIIRNLNQAKINKIPELALTIGNFDGVHFGHKKIIDEIKKIALENNLASAVLTFEPHPQAFFEKNKNENFRIFSLAQKLRILQNHQIDYVFVVPFNQNFANIEAQTFIENILVKTLKIKHLTVGYDFTFGKNRQGNFNILQNKSSNFGFSLNKIDALKKDNQLCSSSLIRNLIKNGKILEANNFLEKNFVISGIVQNGKKLGRTIGFPTANLQPLKQIIKPKYGVYKTTTYIPHLNQKFSSITNFGTKPTLEDKKPQELFETHILNFSQNLYGKKIFVEFIDFIRDEKKFSSIEELKNQINNDILSI